MAEEMVIFTRAFDFLHWLIPRTMGFPRSQRFIVTKRLHDAALDFYERITEANGCRGRDRLARLREADVALDKVRHYLRLAHRWTWLSPGQYQHASKMVAELGRLLGGWIKKTAG
ncbi:MAG: diversity-generating retroelement protein Avd [Anaerolineae bacterium]|jgi:four helix bundle protein